MYFRASKEVKSCIKIAVYKVPGNIKPDENIRDFVIA